MTMMKRILLGSAAGIVLLAVADRAAQADIPVIDASALVEWVTQIANDVKAYPHAGHGFANKLPAQPLLRIAGFGYNQAATEDAWARVFTFFGEHLQNS